MVILLYLKGLYERSIMIYYTCPQTRLLSAAPASQVQRPMHNNAMYNCLRVRKAPRPGFTHS